MNCEDFLERLHDRLDHRLPIDHDWLLQEHAADCDLCRGQLFAWQQISQILPASAVHPAEKPMPLLARLAMSALVVAAAVMFAFFVMTFESGDEPNATISRLAALQRSVPHGELRRKDSGVFDSARNVESLAVGQSSVDATEWIRSVRERQWIDETMPAVHSLREGVAPLGRSLIRAVTLLTTSSAGQPS